MRYTYCPPLRAVAKSLNVGVNKLHKQLRAEGVIDSNNQLLGKYKKNGLFKTKNKSVETGVGPKSHTLILVTPNGEDYLKKITNQDQLH